MTTQDYNVEGKPLRVHELNVEALAQTLFDKKIRTTQGKIIQPLHAGHLTVTNDPGRFKVLACGRRWGKTLYTVLVALAVLMQPRRRVWIVAPDYSLCEKVFRELYNILVTQMKVIRPGKPGGGRARNQRGEYYLETPWGSVLEAKSLENKDSMAGEALDLLIVDEAALDDTIYDVWVQMLKPTLMDKEGSAIFISCLTEDTWINTDRGLEQIKKYVTPEPGMSDLNININTSLGKFSRTTGFWNNGIDTPTKTLTLRSGTKIQGTYDHPVLAMDSTTGEVEWTSLDDIDPSRHYIARDRNPIKFGKEDFTTFFEYDTRENTNFDIPKTITPDLAYLMGLILGDGYINKNYVVVCGFDKETKDFLLSKPCGLNFKQEVRSDGSTGHFRVANKKFSEFLWQFGFLKQKSPKKEIPHRLFTCSKMVVSNFLSGLFDADGCATRGKKAFTRVKYTTTSKNLYEQVLLLTQSFGMYGSVYQYTAAPTKKSKVYSHNYNIEWSANNAKIFFQEISFRIKRKQDLGEYLNSWSMSDGIPGASLLLSKADICIPTKLGKVRDFFAPSYRSLESIRHLIEENKLGSENIDKMLILLNQKFYWDSVSSISIDITKTYDFKVPETESFWANGVVSHNTPRGRNGFYKMFLMGQKGSKQRAGELHITMNDSLGVNDDMSDWSSFKQTSYDNPLLASTPEKSKQEIDNSYREAANNGKVVQFKQEYLADFEAVADIAFPGFQTEVTKEVGFPNVVDYAYHPSEGPIIAACDHNYARPASTIFIQVNKFNDIIVFDEKFTPRTTSYMQAQQILDKEDQFTKIAHGIWSTEGMPISKFMDIKVSEVVADISGNQRQLNGRSAWDDFESVLGFKPKGLKQERETGSDLIRHWLQFPEFDSKGRPIILENNLQKTVPKLFISRNCPNMIYALSTAKFQKTKGGSLKEDYAESPEGYEGLLDALRYALVFLLHDTGSHLTIGHGF